ncbi:MAG: trehalose-phosphatase [Elusimicrobiota bacterium]
MKDRHIQPAALAAALSGRQSLLLGFDFDGTLAAFAPTPGRARLPAATRRMLAALTRQPGWHVAVLSGRGLADVRSKVRIPGVCYGGNHGIELACRRLRWTHPGARRLRPLFRRCAAEVRARLRGFPGTLLEFKGFGFSVHYRGMRRHSPRQLAQAIQDCLKPGLRLVPAKKIWEVRPDLDWDKGRAMLRIARELGSRGILFMGDDATDEEAFRRLRKRAITVRVGFRGKTTALYRMQGVKAVNRFLAALPVRS